MYKQISPSPPKKAAPLIVLFLLLFIAVNISGNASANPLVGTWQLDHERTIAEASKMKDISPSLLNFLKIFKDNSTFKYTENKKITLRNNKAIEQQYQVTGSTSNSITIKILGGQAISYEQTYYFEDDAMYALTSKYKVKQYYRRVTK